MGYRFFYLKVPLEYVGMTYRAKTARSTGLDQVSLYFLTWFQSVFLFCSNTVLGAFVHAGWVVVGCWAWAKIGS